MTVPFTYEEGSLFVRLLIAHIITDFVLQTDRSVANKEKLVKGSAFWLHGLYTGVVAALFVWDHVAWLPLAILTVTHMVIDYLKIVAGRTNKNKAVLFILDQLLHTIVLALVWLMLIDGYPRAIALLRSFVLDYPSMLKLLAYLIVIYPVTYLIRFLTYKWAQEVADPSQSLPDAGKWIGILERVIVVTLVFANQFTAIGFLATSKSILRLIDKPEGMQAWSSRKHTEYVLIGTFLSFSAALITAIVAKTAS